VYDVTEAVESNFKKDFTTIIWTYKNKQTG
jgi:hypothetical protein